MNYTVKSGDTVGKIAKAFGLTESDVINDNEILVQNPDYIQVGQILSIPESSMAINIVDQPRAVATPVYKLPSIFSSTPSTTSSGQGFLGIPTSAWLIGAGVLGFLIIVSIMRKK